MVCNICTKNISSQNCKCKTGECVLPTDDISVDVIIVGAGVIGCSIARELSKFDCKVIVLEKELDLCQGASKANSGIVHGGYDAKHGTVKSMMSRKGNQLFEELDRELNFGFKKIGSLVFAFTDKEVEELLKLKKNGELNGVHDLEIIEREKILELEPHASVGVKAALYCPSAGIVSPYEYCFSLAENAVQNGVIFEVGEEVQSIDAIKSLQNKQTVFRVGTCSGKVFKSRVVINCAGIFADQVSNIANTGLRYSITARKGQYLLLEKSQGHMANMVIFQTPTEKWGKGILVAPTARGNLLLGPSAAEQDDKYDKDTDINELAYVAWAARRSVPHLDTRQALTSFSGLRARGSTQDFIIQNDPKLGGFIHVAGIESPGLTSSPAIARKVVNIIKDECGLNLKPCELFNPIRKHPVNFAKPPLPEKFTIKDLENRQGGDEIICFCENITRGEVEAAVVNAGVTLGATDSVKWRTRAGMGPCQGARCRTRVAEIVAEKLNNGATFQDIPKRIPSNSVTKRVSRGEMSKL